MTILCGNKCNLKIQKKSPVIDLKSFMTFIKRQYFYITMPIYISAQTKEAGVNYTTYLINFIENNSTWFAMNWHQLNFHEMKLLLDMPEFTKSVSEYMNDLWITIKLKIRSHDCFLENAHQQSRYVCVDWPGKSLCNNQSLNVHIADHLLMYIFFIYNEFPLMALLHSSIHRKMSNIVLK